MISPDEQSALDVIETSPAGTPYAKNAKTLAQGLRRREAEIESLKKLIQATAMDGAFVDERGITWNRPTSEAYYRVCGIAERLEAKLALAEKVVEAASGFRDHGEAKNGTHANLLFEALAAYDEAVKK